MSYADLKGKVFIVTGAASGMGRATALLLAGQGAQLGLLDLRKPDIEKFEQGIAFAVACDVGKRDQVDRAVKEVKSHFGRLDGAANMAGRYGNNTVMGTSHAIEVLEDKEWEDILSTNLDGMKNCLRAELSNMSGPGAIVNAASITGQYGAPFKGPYSVSKFGVISLTQATAHEAGVRNIRVNAVAPGIIDTPMAQAAGNKAELEAALTSRTALRRLGEPEEVARVILFLLSDQSSYISATIVNVDAGYY